MKQPGSDVHVFKLAFEHVVEIINWSSMKQPGSDVHVFKLAFEHVEDIFSTDFKCV